MSGLDQVDTVVLVMMENRSFDHILGHLSYGPFANGTKVDGLREPLEQGAYENLYEGEPYYPFVMPDHMLVSDVPHEREFVATQLLKSDVAGRYTMGGFAKSYFDANPNDRQARPPAMGFLPPQDVPITSFLANQYAVCDRWFTPIPTSTQPNRMMALYGSSAIDKTRGIFPTTSGPLILDWLTKRDVPWRVYHDGLSYFLLLGEFELALSDRFRPFGLLARDVATEPDATFPRVIIVEPSYGDAPQVGTHMPNDNHPPTAVAFGEHFVAEIYRALTRNPARWARTVMILTYDEHGGFFDHVEPLPIPYAPPPGAEWSKPFESTGPRVPAIVVSPLVERQAVWHEPMDHTSILQLIAQRFGRNGESYSPDVEQRARRGIRSVANVLARDTPRTDIPQAPPDPLPVRTTVGGSRPAQPTEMQLAFENAAATLVKQYPEEAARRYPDLLHWHHTAVNA